METKLTKTTRHPVDISMLEIIRRLRPVGAPCHKPDHLLPSANVVDDCGGRLGGVHARRVKGCEFGGDAGIGDEGGVVVEAACADVDAAMYIKVSKD